MSTSTRRFAARAGAAAATVAAVAFASLAMAAPASAAVTDTTYGIYDLKVTPKDSDHFSPGAAGTVSFQVHPEDVSPVGYDVKVGETSSHTISLPAGLTPNPANPGTCVSSTTQYWDVQCSTTPSSMTLTRTRVSGNATNTFATQNTYTFGVLATDELENGAPVTATFAPAASDISSAADRALTETAHVVYALPSELTSPLPGASITPDTEFAGTGAPGSTVAIKDKDGKVLGQATIGNDGKWSTTLSPAPTNGANDLVIEVTDKNGDTEKLAENTYDMTGSINKFEVVTPNLSETSTLADGTVFTGRGEPGTTVVITDVDGNQVGEATVDDNGDWTTPVTGLIPGPNNITVTATLPGGEQIIEDLGPIVTVEDTESTPLMDPLVAGSAGLVMLAAAGAFVGLRRRAAVTA